MSKHRAKTNRSAPQLVPTSIPDPLPEIRVTMRHARACCYPDRGVMCAPGVRAWFARHDMDYRQFLRHGIPLSEAETIDDEFARRVVALARAEANSGR